MTLLADNLGSTTYTQIALHKPFNTYLWAYLEDTWNELWK